jgi:hypothetical protein
MAVSHAPSIVRSDDEPSDNWMPEETSDLEHVARANLPAATRLDPKTPKNPTGIV